MIFWQWVWNQMQIHQEALWTLAAIGFLVFGATIPEKFPTSVQEWWTWFRSFVLEFMSLRSGKLVSGPPPKPAVSVPEPIEAPKETHA